MFTHHSEHIASLTLQEILLAQMRHSPEEKQHALQILELQEIQDKVLLPGSDEVPHIFAEPNALNAYLRMMDEALQDEEYKKKIVEREDILTRLAEIEMSAEQDEETPALLAKVYEHFSLVTDDVSGDQFAFEFSGGQFIKTVQLKNLDGAPPPDELTLKKVYEFLRQRQEEGLEVSPFKDEDVRCWWSL